MAIRRCVLALVLPLMCVGQFTSMSTDFTGRTLFFTTELSQSGSGQPRHGKLFLADSDRVRLFGLRDREVVAGYVRPPNLPITITNYFDLDGVNISSNGSHLSVMGLRDCNDSSTACGYAVGSSLYDSTGKEILNAYGRLILSPNGKWALGVADSLSGPSASYTRYDIEGGKEEKIGSRTSWDWRAHDIANNGTVILRSPYEVSLVPLSGPPQAIGRDESESGEIQSAVIDAGARIVVWERSNFNGVLNLFLVRTWDPGRIVRLADGGFQPKISDDGTTVLYLRRTDNEDQVFVIRVEGGAARQVTTEVDGVATAVLSGDGHVAWVQTKSGELLKFDLEAGNREQFTGPLPSWLLHSSWRRARQIAYGTPGEVLQIPASVMPGEKVEIAISDQLVPVIGVEPQRVRFQIPWSLGEGSELPLSIGKPDSAGWLGNLSYVTVHRVFTALTGAFHPSGDPVSYDKVARAGERIRLHARGFGPVDPPVADGEPSPAAPPSQTVTPVGCELWNNSQEMVRLKVAFAGLAAGLVGVYGIDVELPAALPHPNQEIVGVRPVYQLRVSCGLVLDAPKPYTAHWTLAVEK